jgi:putative addiction module CopG family antidote
MVEILVRIPQPVNDFIEAQVAAGRFRTASEYLGDLVRADQQQQSILEQLADSAPLAERIDEGLASHEGRRWTPAVLTELRQQVIARDRSAKEVE